MRFYCSLNCILKHLPVLLVLRRTDGLGGSVFSFFKGLAGQKAITKEAIAPVLDKMKEHLICELQFTLDIFLPEVKCFTRNVRVQNTIESFA